MEDKIQKLQDLLNAGNGIQALSYFETLSPEERGSWEIQNLAGVACVYCGQHKRARELFLSALQKYPDHPDLLYKLADTYCALGNFQEARETLERCVQQDIADELQGDVSFLMDKIKAEEEKSALKRVLMVAYYFPPLGGSGVFRSLKFAKYLPESGWNPTVISTDIAPKFWNFTDSSLVAEIPTDMKVLRVPDLLQTKRTNGLSWDKVKSVCTFLHDILRYDKEADALYSDFVRTEAGLRTLLGVPCGALSWAYDTIQYIEENLDIRQFQVIYTTSGPGSAHLIGFYFKQKYGIPWVADYRDLWTGSPYNDYTVSNSRDRLLFRLESILLHQADCNISVGEEWARSYVERFQVPGERVKCITNGYDEADFTGLKMPVEKKRQIYN